MTEQDQATVESTAIAEHLTLLPMKAEVNLLPETLELIRSASAYKTLEIKIGTPQDRATASDQRAKIKGLIKLIDEKRTELKKPFDEGGKEVQAYFKPYLETLASVDKVIESAAIDFDNEQERLRKLAAARAEEDARKEREKLAQQAAKAADKGKFEKSEALLDQAATVVAMPVSIAPAKQSGESHRTTYSAEVTDPATLIKAVAAPMLMRECGGDAAKLLQIVTLLAMSNVPAVAVVPDTKFLDKQAVALKEHFSYPGCKLSKKSSIAAKSANPLK